MENNKKRYNIQKKGTRYPLMHLSTPPLMCDEPPYRKKNSMVGISRIHFNKTSPKKLCDQRMITKNPEGESYGIDQLMTKSQIKQITMFMESTGLKDDLTIESLLACKIIIGRWPIAQEMIEIFGDVVDRVYKKTLPMFPLSPDDPPVGTGKDMKQDKRISHIIGINGTMLHSIALESNALFIWVTNDGKMSVYATGNTPKEVNYRIDLAFELINATWKNYAPWPGSLSHSFSEKGLRVGGTSQNNGPTEQVGAKHLQMIMSRQNITVTENLNASK